MKEFQRILALYHKIDQDKQKAALATVLCVEGSSYRRPGARMLITSDGKWEGAISGGCLEGDVLRKARHVMNSGVPDVITYNTMDDTADVFGIRLGCNGIIRILLEPVDFSNPENTVLILKDLLDIHEPKVLVTLFNAAKSSTFTTGQRILFNPDTENNIPGWMQEGCQIAIKAGKSHVATNDMDGAITEALFELIEPQVQLVIFGAGYDVYPLMNMAKEIGWRVILSDECQVQLLTKQKSCADAIICGNSNHILNEINIHYRTAAVLISHNYRNDVSMLRALIRTNIPYIGILGPRVRFDKMWDEIEQTMPALSPTDTQRIYAPIGLDIGAETPEEIALSIIAEIKATFTGRTGVFLRDRCGSIHERGVGKSFI